MMYEFFNRLVNIALPRVRDFKGLSGKSFDGRGNYALGIREQLIFPEIHYDKIDKIKGMNIVIVTTAKTDEGLWVTAFPSNPSNSKPPVVTASTPMVDTGYTAGTTGCWIRKKPAQC